jgi:hypothetical protein
MIQGLQRFATIAFQDLNSNLELGASVTEQEPTAGKRTSIASPPIEFIFQLDNMYFILVENSRELSSTAMVATLEAIIEGSHQESRLNFDGHVMGLQVFLTKLDSHDVAVSCGDDITTARTLGLTLLAHFSDPSFGKFKFHFYSIFMQRDNVFQPTSIKASYHPQSLTQGRLTDTRQSAILDIDIGTADIILSLTLARVSFLRFLDSKASLTQCYQHFSPWLTCLLSFL